MKILLDIPDAKAAFFMEVLKNFSFVKIAEPQTAENTAFVEGLKPMSMAELNERITQSETDFDAGRYKSATDLLAKYK